MKITVRVGLIDQFDYQSLVAQIFNMLILPEYKYLVGKLRVLFSFFLSSKFLPFRNVVVSGFSI